MDFILCSPHTGCVWFSSSFFASSGSYNGGAKKRREKEKTRERKNVLASIAHVEWKALLLSPLAFFDVVVVDVVRHRQQHSTLISDPRRYLLFRLDSTRLVLDAMRCRESEKESSGKNDSFCYQAEVVNNNNKSTGLFYYRKDIHLCEGFMLDSFWGKSIKPFSKSSASCAIERPECNLFPYHKLKMKGEHLPNDKTATEMIVMSRYINISGT